MLLLLLLLVMMLYTHPSADAENQQEISSRRSRRRAVKKKKEKEKNRTRRSIALVEAGRSWKDGHSSGPIGRSHATKTHAFTNRIEKKRIKKKKTKGPHAVLHEGALQWADRNHSRNGRILTERQQGIITQVIPFGPTLLLTPPRPNINIKGNHNLIILFVQSNNLCIIVYVIVKIKTCPFLLFVDIK